MLVFFQRINVKTESTQLIRIVLQISLVLERYFLNNSIRIKKECKKPTTSSEPNSGAECYAARLEIISVTLRKQIVIITGNDSKGVLKERKRCPVSVCQPFIPASQL